MEEARGEKDKLPKKRKGVPPLFVSNPDFRRDFLDNIRLGLNIDDSCHLAGCHPSSFDLWKQKANKGMEEYRDFMLEIAKARAECKSVLVRKVHDASDDPRNWTAAMTLLERLFPEEFGRKDKKIVEEDKKVSINVNSVSAEEVAKRRELEKKEREALDAEVVEDGC